MLLEEGQLQMDFISYYLSIKLFILNLQHLTIFITCICLLTYDSM